MGGKTTFKNDAVVDPAFGTHRHCSGWKLQIKTVGH
jgi:hypothetical protein